MNMIFVTKLRRKKKEKKITPQHKLTLPLQTHVPDGFLLLTLPKNIKDVTARI